MTEKQKQIAVVAFVIIIALFFLLRGSNDRATTVINDNGEVIALPGLEAGSIYIGERRPFILPDFANVNGANNLSAIGACCADCSPRSNTSSYRPTNSGITFVTNMGNSGPNVFNYYAPQQPAFSFKSRGVFTAKPS